MQAPVTRRFGRTAKIVFSAVCGLLATLGGTLWFLHASWTPARADLATARVEYERLKPTLVARGDLEAVENSDIVCRVRSWNRNSTFATTIKRVVDEGTPVRKGQVVCELDDSALREDLQARRVPLELAQTAWIQAEEAAKIVASQNEGNLDKTETVLKLARLDLEKYRQGDLEQARKDLAGRLALAEADLASSGDRAAWAERMERRGYQSSTQALNEKFRSRNSRLALNKLKEEQRVLEQYTKTRAMTDLEAKVLLATERLEQVKIQARAKSSQAEVDCLSKRRIFERRRIRFQEIEAEIKKCVLVAPNDGLIVYSIPDQVRFGGGSQGSIIAPGEPVREGQRLMRVPNLSQFQVNVRVHEASIGQVQGERWRSTGFSEALEAAWLVSPNLGTRLAGPLAYESMRPRFLDRAQQLIYGGQKAIIRLDAFPNRVFQGHVKHVANVPTVIDSMVDVRAYQVQVILDESAPGIRPDMSAQVTIFSDEALYAVLAIPMQAIVHSPEQGNHGTCFVLTSEGPEERDVLLGTHTEQLVEVLEGLLEGEAVVLNPQPLLAVKNRNETEEEGNPR